MLKLLSLIFFWALCGSATAAAPTIEVSEVWKFPAPSWVENIALRSNGQILVTEITQPKVYQVDPTGSKPAALVTTVSDRKALLGITETSKDVFYIVAGNVTVVGTPDSAPHTYGIYKIDVSNFQPGYPVAPTLVADFPKAGFLNGLTTVSDKYILASDSTGAVWRLNVETGKKDIILQGPLVKPETFIGVNGVRVQDGKLYFVNLDKGILAQVSIDSKGLPTSRSKVIVSGFPTPDDFALGSTNKIHGPNGFVAANGTLQRFAHGKRHLISKNKLLKGATSAAIAEPGVVYVSTHSGDVGNEIQGRVVKVTIRQ